MDDLTSINEDQLLGEAPAADEAVSVEMQPDPAPVTDAPTVPETPVPQADQTAAQYDDQTAFGRAMAAQRAEYEAKMELARQQAAQEAWIAAQRALSPQQETEQQAEIPDPIVDPEGFTHWLNQRDQANAQRFEQQMQERFTAYQREQSLQTAMRDAGENWSALVGQAQANIHLIAPLLGVDPVQLGNQIAMAPNAGQLIKDWATRVPGSGAAPVDVAAIEAKAKAEALKELQAKASASPHNLAVPGVGSVPMQVVNQPKIVSEDEILSQ